MPQLDKIITFTQIFWMFLVLVFLYTVLTHFFLPIFLKSLKSRKLVVEINSMEINYLSSKKQKKQILLNQVLLDSLIIVEKLLWNKFSLENFLDIGPCLMIVDKKISSAAQKSVLYCSQQLFELVSFYPRWMN